MKRIIPIIICLFVWMNAEVLAQETAYAVQDLEQWTSFGVSKKFGKKFTLSLDQEFRFEHNASQFDKYFTDIGFNYKINKYFKLGINYRYYKNKNKDDIYITNHRWSGDVTSKYKLDRFSVSYRLRYQNKSDEPVENEDSENKSQIRNKLMLKYNIKDFKIDPYAYTEFFNILEYPDLYPNKIRFNLGVKYNMKSFGETKLFYQIDREINLENPFTTFILGIGYNYKF